MPYHSLFNKRTYGKAVRIDPALYVSALSNKPVRTERLRLENTDTFASNLAYVEKCERERIEAEKIRLAIMLSKLNGGKRKKSPLPLRPR